MRLRQPSLSPPAKNEQSVHALGYPTVISAPPTRLGEVFGSAETACILDSAFSAKGYSKENAGIIVGEANYNGAIAASSFQAAVAWTGRTIFHVIQWPQYRSQAKPDPLPTTQFDDISPGGF